jgi:small ligand-binding sensory domain FIST
MPLLQERLQIPALIGCSGGGIVGIDRQGEAQEVEGEPALSLTLMHLPNVGVRAFHITADDLPDLDSPPDAWVEVIGVSPQEQPQFVLLSDPFSAKINELIEGLDFAYPGAVKVGGLASAGLMGVRTGLFCNYHIYQVVKGERNIVLELTEDESLGLRTSNQPGRAALEVLRHLIQDLSEADRQLAQNNSLFVGVARDEFKQQLGRGDFLIRNLLGVDPRAGALAIGDRVRPGQRIQFHLRDAQASAEDLEVLLQNYRDDGSNSSAVGALMFSCLGRGKGLYGEPNFDSRLFHRYLPNIPLGGFFCNGEIGPVSGSTFLHGYTSVFGICRQP